MTAGKAVRLEMGRFPVMVAMWRFPASGTRLPCPAPRGAYVFDRVAGTTERVTDGTNFLGGAHYGRVVVSDDGRFVAFVTREFNSGEDVILFDRQSDTWEVANPRLGGVAPLFSGMGHCRSRGTGGSSPSGPPT